MNKFILLSFFFFSSASALACQCKSVMIKPIEEKADYIFSAANNVFLAKITSSDLIGKIEADSTTHHNFSLINTFKGHSNFPYLSTGGGLTSCDDSLIVDTHYIIFSDSKEVWNCTALYVNLEDEYYHKLVVKLTSLSKVNITRN